MTNEEALEHFRKLAEQDKAKAREAQALPSCPSCGQCNHCGRGGYHVWPYYPVPVVPYWEYRPTYTVPSITWTVGTTSTGLLST